MDLTQEEYAKDPRIACKYGRKCYQKNPSHHNKYKHPPRKRQGDEHSENRNKKPRLEDSNSNSSDSSRDYQPVEKLEVISESASETNEDETVESIETNAQTSEGAKTIEHQEIKANSNGAISKEVENKKILKGFDNKEFIKSKFLVEMPDDFYQFWDFCKGVNSKNPLLALKEVDLTLVGPFEVLAGKFDDTIEQSNEKYLLHWRFYYDPPEFQTVLVGNASGYHVGYFRDEPTKPPVFLAENCADKDGSFSVIGGNIFAAVHLRLTDLLKTASPFKKMSIQRFVTLIKKEAEKLNLDLSKRSASISKRDRSIVARSFNTLGMVVPYDKKTELGCRPLSMSNRELKALFEKLSKASGGERERLMSEFQTVLTNTSIATDECDFATGLELGLDMLFYGIDYLNSLIKQYLCTAYDLLNRSEFSRIAAAHMDDRRRGSDLSII